MRRKAKRKTSRKRGRSDRGFWFDDSEADRKSAWFGRYLCHTKGEWAGQPFELARWQRDQIVRPLFGWKRPDGLRRYRTVYVELPKKNGKSALCAGLALLMLTSDGEPGAEIYSAAADRDQARIVFDTAKQMAEDSPAIARRVKIYRSAIEYPSNHSVYRVLSADARTKHGFNAHGVIFDELHAQPNRELWDTLTMGVAARRQPLVIAITNSGSDRESICYEQHRYAERVRDGEIPDDSFLPVLYNAPKDCNPFDESVWREVNPGLGDTVKLDYLRTEALKAKESLAYLNTFRRLHLGQWTEGVERWIDMDQWRECGGAIVESELEGRECYGGLDLASTTDIAAFVLAFPPVAENERWKLVCRFWVPEEGIALKARKDLVPYPEWQRAGWIKATDGATIDFDVIRGDIRDMGRRFNVREIAFDRWGAEQIRTQLSSDGFEMVQFGQGYGSMSGPSKDFLAKLGNREIQHGDNPVLTWMAGNVQAKVDDAENVKPTKAKSRVHRIDGIVASIMALGRGAVSTKTDIRLWTIA